MYSISCLDQISLAINPSIHQSKGRTHRNSSSNPTPPRESKCKSESESHGRDRWRVGWIFSFRHDHLFRRLTRHTYTPSDRRQTVSRCKGTLNPQPDHKLQAFLVPITFCFEVTRTWTNPCPASLPRLLVPEPVGTIGRNSSA
jgi:hypothetical protein